MPVVMHIDSDRYVLDDDADHDRLRADLVAAVQNGGDLVHVVHRRGSSDALVSAGTHVRVDYLPDPDPEEPDDPDLSFIDFDF